MPDTIFISGIERLLTMVLHISWSVMVLKSVVMKKPVWLMLAFALHTVIDAAAVLMSAAGVSGLIIEGVVLVFAAAALVYIIVEFKKYKGGEFTCESLKNS